MLDLSSSVVNTSLRSVPYPTDNTPPTQQPALLDRFAPRGKAHSFLAPVASNACGVFPTLPLPTLQHLPETSAATVSRNFWWS